MHINELLDKYKAGIITPDELILLENWYLQWKPESQPLSDEDIETAKTEVWGSIVFVKEPDKNKRLWWPLSLAAASVLLFLAVGGYFFFEKHPQLVVVNQQTDLSPARNQMTLTLAGGQKIKLIKGLKGKLASQGNTLIAVNKANAIAYTVVPSGVTLKNTYNTLSTGKGEQSPYPLILADGTKVWLNAESSITFPIAFNESERSVKITGEAYFEVLHDEAKPFKVTVKGQTVEDIGTAFNINAYDDERIIRTTLISGEVKVSLSNATAINKENNVKLKPGQQAVDDDGKLNVSEGDTEMALAWKNGLFQYKNATIQTLMRQISRWYDVEIQYEGPVPLRKFSGKMQRDLNASQVLGLLSFTKIHFRIEGKKIIVTP